MNLLRRELLRPSTMIALVALFVALGGTAYAAATIRSADIVDGTIATVDLKPGAVGTRQLAPGARPPARFNRAISPVAEDFLLRDGTLAIVGACTGTAGEPEATLHIGSLGNVVEVFGTRVRGGAAAPAKVSFTGSGSLVLENPVANRFDRVHVDVRVGGRSWDVTLQSVVRANQPCRFTGTVLARGAAT